MMRSSIVVTLLLTCSMSFASNDGGREFQIVFGAGAGKSMSSAVNDAGTSNFDGWAPALELGIEIPWSQRSGVSVTGEYKFIDSTNSTNAVTLIEKSEGHSQAMKLGIFYGGFTMGTGLSQDSLLIRQVSVTSGAKETKLAGTSSVVFIQYSMVTKPFGRLAFEGQYRTGKLDNVTLTESAAYLKYVLLFPL